MMKSVSIAYLRTFVDDLADGASKAKAYSSLRARSLLFIVCDATWWGREGPPSKLIQGSKICRNTSNELRESQDEVYAILT